MTTNIKRTRRPHLPGEFELDPTVARYLCGLASDAELRDDVVIGIRFFSEPASGEALWRKHRALLLAAWAAQAPGTRPPMWWEHLAPELRLRLGGVGEVYHASIGMERGVPLGWNSRTIDPRNPPKFEGQGAYLARHGLLLAGEVPPPVTLQPETVGGANA